MAGFADTLQLQIKSVVTDSNPTKRIYKRVASLFISLYRTHRCFLTYTLLSVFPFPTVLTRDRFLAMTVTVVVASVTRKRRRRPDAAAAG